VEHRSDGHSLLIRESVPELIPEQVARFTVESLRARPIRQFDPHLAQDALVAGAASEVLAIDIGGDKLIAAFYQLRTGELEQASDTVIRRNEGGHGYVELLVELADDVRRNKLRVGISFAGLTEGTKVVAAPNLPASFWDLLDRHDRDFADLFPSVAVANDAEAGLMAASVEAIKRDRATRHIIYVINGSGLGGAVLTDRTIFACEPGHIEADPQLNPFKMSKPCGLLGATHVCLEGIAASKAGIENTWRQLRGEPSSGRQIASKYLSGNQLARALYGNSARVTAHVVSGLASAFQLRFDQTSLVAHGGIFQVPDYGERLCSILERGGFSSLGTLFTRDFSANACLDGAAIAAVLMREVGAGSDCARMPFSNIAEALDR
jgi:predicted NBD/HSP70 family sugar kinase